MNAEWKNIEFVFFDTKKDSKPKEQKSTLNF